MGTKTSKLFKKFLTDIPAVMVGLLLALALNSWKEDRDRKMKAQLLVASINKEIKENHKEILSSKDQFLITFKRNDSIINLYERGLINTLEIATITKRLQNVAWKTANTSEDFSAISIKTLIKIATIYKEQDRVDFIIKSIDNYYINNDPDQSGLAKAKIKQNHLSALINRHKDLEKKYREYIESNDNNKPS